MATRQNEVFPSKVYILSNYMITFISYFLDFFSLVFLPFRGFALRYIAKMLRTLFFFSVLLYRWKPERLMWARHHIHHTHTHIDIL